MGFVIGMDEAGYGPNLGPLVLTATVWEVPGRWPKKTDFWKTFDSVAPREIAKQKKGVSGKKADAKDGVDGDSANRPSADDRLHIADSKEVYCPATGLGALEHRAHRSLWRSLARSFRFRRTARRVVGPKLTQRTEPTVADVDATCGSLMTSRSHCR